MASISLVLAAGPGYPDGSTAHRYEMTMTLDAVGQPDADAWSADPDPWRSRREWPDEVPLEGDVQFDPEAGWSLRFFRGPGDAADVPSAGLILSPAPLRPGAYLTIREPDGREFSWRIVGMG